MDDTINIGDFIIIGTSIIGMGAMLYAGYKLGIKTGVLSTFKVFSKYAPEAVNKYFDVFGEHMISTAKANIGLM